MYHKILRCCFQQQLAAFFRIRITMQCQIKIAHDNAYLLQEKIMAPPGRLELPLADNAFGPYCVRGLTCASIVYVTVKGSELLLWNTRPLPANSNVPAAVGTSPRT